MFSKVALPTMMDKIAFENFLTKIDDLLEEVEQILDDDARVGPWLFGPTFSAADISLTALLVRLYQLGMEDRFWKDY